MQANLPNFLIVGSAKSGTTSLYEYLRQHPEVFMPYLKEPAFLAGSETAGRIDSIDEYRALFSEAKNETALGEASTIYLPDPRSPRRIMDVLGTETRIIIVLRNPIDMTYSLWGHRKREGGEERSFMEAIKAGFKRYRGQNKKNALGIVGRLTTEQPYPYVFQARYANQVSSYKSEFDKVKVFIFEELFNNLESEFHHLCRFLRVNDSFRPDFERHNRAGMARSEWVRSLLNDTYFFKEPIKALLPAATRIKIKSLLRAVNTRPKSLPELSSRDRSQLVEFFEDDVEKLEDVLGRSVRKAWPDFQCG